MGGGERGCCEREGGVMRGCVVRWPDSREGALWEGVMNGCCEREGGVMRGCVVRWPDSREGALGMSRIVVRGYVMRGCVMRGCIMRGCVMIGCVVGRKGVS